MDVSTTSGYAHSTPHIRPHIEVRGGVRGVESTFWFGELPKGGWQPARCRTIPTDETKNRSVYI
jgi:hypothetical protein